MLLRFLFVLTSFFLINLNLHLGSFSANAQQKKKCPPISKKYSFDNKTIGEVFRYYYEHDFSGKNDRTFPEYFTADILRAQMTIKPRIYTKSPLEAGEEFANLKFITPPKGSTKLCATLFFGGLEGEPTIPMRCYIQTNGQTDCETNLTSWVKMYQQYEAVWGNVRIAKTDKKSYVLLYFCKEGYLNSWFLLGKMIRKKDSSKSIYPKVSVEEINKELVSIGFDPDFKKYEDKNMYPIRFSFGTEIAC